MNWLIGFCKSIRSSKNIFFLECMNLQSKVTSPKKSLLHAHCTNCEQSSGIGLHWMNKTLHKLWVCWTCQVQMNTIIGFPKPQVACSIHAGGTSYGISATLPAILRAWISVSARAASRSGYVTGSTGHNLPISISSKTLARSIVFVEACARGD